ncbi:hypothetical protein T492DRAFT_964799 [Pavlovales sp. CCMP2436]|nr:hypothetical protein T492DRAFT_964799 [Pavlovales sp. CCMP2436]|mmetsp:Transcript_12570/g.31848  ORF Transcript_12570/g.31848 Transcript_12570/m.31848 type:complete len:159 (-) Transcript_12570:162-638(-)|eukprot:CAMPEP_0179890628 /NCGR_PEP_ID=MMETSP0982-20121206/33230_1 /TAXON_ID=483367 /ORGANISM="non described non described, Strain CCMP 2436" /LENGTH=158 /DNA_ID=CAMNT_0021786917 /DNA_START=59 /DNA_END=538 /DNA_ORIENTATION=+
MAEESRSAATSSRLCDGKLGPKSTVSLKPARRAPGRASEVICAPSPAMAHGERHVRTRLLITVDANVRWLRDSVAAAKHDDVQSALEELRAVLDHLQSCGRLGRQRMVEYCNTVVELDGLALLHSLSEGKVPGFLSQDDIVVEYATRLFRDLVPLIWN